MKKLNWPVAQILIAALFTLLLAYLFDKRLNQTDCLIRELEEKHAASQKTMKDFVHKTAKLSQDRVMKNINILHGEVMEGLHHLGNVYALHLYFASFHDVIPLNSFIHTGLEILSPASMNKAAALVSEWGAHTLRNVTYLTRDVTHEGPAPQQTCLQRELWYRLWKWW